jgi:FtsP/CotA-like multicopper oxidase with cupredoxin domain
MTRRGFAAGAGAIATATLFDSRSSLGEITPTGWHLPIPQLIDAASQNNVVKLNVEAGHHAFYNGKPTRTLGYSAPFLGPVIRFRRGDRVEMIVHSTIDAHHCPLARPFGAGRRRRQAAAKDRAGFNVATDTCCRPAGGDALVPSAPASGHGTTNLSRSCGIDHRRGRQGSLLAASVWRG